MADATHSRDKVLVAFHAACPRPTVDELTAWIERYPAFANDIRAHAEAVLASIQERHLHPEPSDALLYRTRSVALDALAAARARAMPSTAASLEELMTAAGTDIPRLARALGIGRAPLVDLIQGRVLVPAPAALIAILAEALRTTVTAVDAAIRAVTPRIGIAKAEGATLAPGRRFADIVRTAPTMTDENRTRWLALLQED